jgi:hypothetical protein
MLLLLACASGSPFDSASPASDPVPDGVVAMTDTNNYSYTLAMDIGATELTAADNDTLEWGALTTDMQGFAVDPAADVDVIDLVWFRDLTQAEVTDAIVTGSLVQSSVGLLARGYPEPGETDSLLSRFDVYGTPFLPSQYLTEPGGTWLLRVHTRTNPSAMLHFLVPGIGGRTVHIDDTSAALDFTADLSTLTPVTLGDEPRVSWDALTRDGRGAPIDPLELQELTIGRYDVGVAELEGRFFELESLAAERWTVNVYGEESVDLRDAVSDAGAAFTGVDDVSTWVLALRCIVCTTPSPGYLTLLR